MCYRMTFAAVPRNPDMNVYIYTHTINPDMNVYIYIHTINPDVNICVYN